MARKKKLKAKFVHLTKTGNAEFVHSHNKTFSVQIYFSVKTSCFALFKIEVIRELKSSVLHSPHKHGFRLVQPKS